jgi:hypothetical protein
MGDQERFAEIGRLTVRVQETKRERAKLSHQIEEAGESLRLLGGLLVAADIMDRGKISVALERLPDKAALRELLLRHSSAAVEISTVTKQLRDAGAI